MTEIKDRLTADGIRKHLDLVCSAFSIEYLEEVTSTNTLLKERVHDGVPAGTVLVADHQTLGRGRSGHSFHSPAGTGIYMSLLLDTSGQEAGKTLAVTTMSAVAAAEAAEAVSGQRALIKWVNDIYMDDRKVCGILAEAVCSPGSGTPDLVVLGVGFNVYPPENGFPEELTGIAGTVLAVPMPGIRDRLAAEFLHRFYTIFSGGRPDYEQEYRARSLLTGRRIFVLTPGGSRSATALGLDEELRLNVRYDDGTEACLNAGEVSLRIS